MIDQATFIKLAREAGFVHSNSHSAVIVRHSNGAWVSIEERLHQFAVLVAAVSAAAEREACAKVCDVEAERLGWPTERFAADNCAAAIRARSST